MNSEFLPTKTSTKRCIIIISIMFALFLIENTSIKSNFDSIIFTNILKPLLWGSLIIFICLMPRIKPNGKTKLRSFLNWWALNFAVIFIVVSVIAGLIDGLGKSPYSHSLRGVITNIVAVGVVLVAMEYARGYIINSLTKKENYLVFISISIFMTFISLPFNQISNLQGLESIVEFIARYAAPKFAKNLFASYLVFLGGPITSIIYLGILEGFHWLSPVLPNLKWIIDALIGVLCPLFSLLAIQNIYSIEAKLLNKRDEEGEGPIGWMVTSVISIALIWFAVGVFPIYPSVIATGSMEPMIKPGDVILVRKIDGKEAQIGDVVQFKRDNVLISHRILDRIEENGIISYRTKGDNNTGVDTELVRAEYVKGRVIQVVPKIGWPTLLLKSKDDIPLDDIEF